MQDFLLRCGDCSIFWCLPPAAPTSHANTPVVVFPDMDYQKRYEPQGDRSFNGNKSFFADQRSSRRPVEGTVARGHLVEDESFSTGVVNNSYVGRNPRPVTADLLKQGQARFNTIARRATIGPVRAVDSLASAPSGSRRICRSLVCAR